MVRIDIIIRLDFDRWDNLLVSTAFWLLGKLFWMYFRWRKLTLTKRYDLKDDKLLFTLTNPERE